jgi:protein-S-isoprenylcysteine O-methyltransferase Ste14
MWTEKRRMRKLGRARLAAALVGFFFAIWGGWFGGPSWGVYVTLVILGLIIFPFWWSDRQVEAEWKTRKAAREAKQ